MSGIELCWAAFERLKKSALTSPDIAKAITSSLVSEEAGYDRGYLKKSRDAHIPLIRAIELYRADQKIVNDSTKQNLKRLRGKLEAHSKKAEELEIMLNESLAREIRMANQIRLLEKEVDRLRKMDNVSPIIRKNRTKT